MPSAPPPSTGSSLPHPDAADTLGHTRTHPSCGEPPPAQSTPMENLPGRDGHGAIAAHSAAERSSEKNEDASLSPTLNNGKSHIQPPKVDSSAQTHDVPAANPQTKPSLTKSSRPSFLTKVVHILVPCLFPSPRFHVVELDDNPPFSENLEKSQPAQRLSTPREPPVPPKGSSVEINNPLPADSSIAGKPPQAKEAVAEKHTSSHLPVHDITSSGVQIPGSTGHAIKVPISDLPSPVNQPEGDDSEGSSVTEEEDLEDVVEDPEDEDKLILNGGAGIPVGPDGIPRPLLPPISPQHAGRKCLILDLDETLVHSSFKSIQQADYVVPVEIEYHWHNVYVIKRPGVDNFLKRMGEIYEVVVFTASLSKYADPVLDKLDIHQVVSHRLFRESCYNHKGNYVKDLSQLGRPIADTIILDNSPASYIFHPNNAVPVSSWFNDPHDTELTDLVPFLVDLGGVDDVRGILDGAR